MRLEVLIRPDTGDQANRDQCERGRVTDPCRDIPRLESTTTSAETGTLVIYHIITKVEYSVTFKIGGET